MIREYIGYYPHLEPASQVYVSWLQQYGSVIGSVLGVLVGIAFSYILAWQAKRQKRDAILNELRINKGLLPQKIEHLQKMKTALEKSLFLPGTSLPLLTRAYNAYVSEIGYQYFARSLENLHIIYETMNTVDGFMNHFTINLSSEIGEKTTADPFKVRASQCAEVIKRCGLIMELIDEILDPTKTPRNVLR